MPAPNVFTRRLRASKSWPIRHCSRARQRVERGRPPPALGRARGLAAAGVENTDRSCMDGPRWARGFWRRWHLVWSSHVSGLSARSSTAGHDGLRGLGSRHCGALLMRDDDSECSNPGPDHCAVAAFCSLPVAVGRRRRSFDLKGSWLARFLSPMPLQHRSDNFLDKLAYCPSVTLPRFFRPADLSCRKSGNTPASALRIPCRSVGPVRLPPGSSGIPWRPTPSEILSLSQELSLLLSLGK